MKEEREIDLGMTVDFNGNNIKVVRIYKSLNVLIGTDTKQLYFVKISDCKNL